MRLAIKIAEVSTEQKDRISKEDLKKQKRNYNQKSYESAYNPMSFLNHNKPMDSAEFNKLTPDQQKDYERDRKYNMANDAFSMVFNPFHRTAKTEEERQKYKDMKAKFKQQKKEDKNKR